VQAVNILVTDAIPNRVAGVTGVRVAWSAYPTQVSRTRSPPRVSSIAPDKSRVSPHELSRLASASSRSASVGTPRACHHSGGAATELGQEAAAFTSSATLFSTLGVHFVSA
jgi:hypothetical protein